MGVGMGCLPAEQQREEEMVSGPCSVPVCLMCVLRAFGKRQLRIIKPP